MPTETWGGGEMAQYVTYYEGGGGGDGGDGLYACG